MDHFPDLSHLNTPALSTTDRIHLLPTHELPDEILL